MLSAKLMNLLHWPDIVSSADRPMIIEVDLPLPWIVLCILQDSVVSVGVAQDAFTAAASIMARGETERNNEDGGTDNQALIIFLRPC